MTKVLDAAQRVRDAMQETRDREAAGVAVVAEAERERRVAAVAAERASRDAHEQADAAKAAGREALSVAGVALQRLEYAERTAARLLTDHARDHIVRRDVAELALSDLLGRIDVLAIERQLREEAARLPGRLCDPARVPAVADALRLAGLVGLARDADGMASVLRGLLDDGQFSPLSTAEFEDARATAKTHLVAIREALQVARRDHGYVGEAMQRLELGQTADAATPAAGVLDANEVAQAALRELNAVLNPTTAEEAT